MHLVSTRGQISLWVPEGRRGFGAATAAGRPNDRVKAELDRRRREGESSNDVLERLLDESTESDFYDGFGTLSDEQAGWIREKRQEARERRKERMRRLEKG
jgi:predicted CopG family antitoxin